MTLSQKDMRQGTITKNWSIWNKSMKQNNMNLTNVSAFQKYLAYQIIIIIAL